MGLHHRAVFADHQEEEQRQQQSRAAQEERIAPATARFGADIRAAFRQVGFAFIQQRNPFRQLEPGAREIDLHPHIKAVAGIIFVEHHLQPVIRAAAVIDQKAAVDPGLGQYCLLALDILAGGIAFGQDVRRQQGQGVMILIARLVPLHRRPIEHRQLGALDADRRGQVSGGSKIGGKIEYIGSGPGTDPLAVGQDDVPGVVIHPLDGQRVAIALLVEGVAIAGKAIDIQAVVSLEIEAVQLAGEHPPLHGVGHHGAAVGAQIHLGFHKADLAFAGQQNVGEKEQKKRRDKPSGTFHIDVRVMTGTVSI